MLTDDEIQKIVSSSNDLEAAGKKLIKEANNKGGRDNIAVVLVEPFGGQND
jgi:protein phosphatase